MQTEPQIQSAATPAIAPQVDSDESKSKRGGKRPGAGRKPNLAKVLLKGVSRTTILAAVENVDVGRIIIGLLKSKREQTRIEALHFIFDRVMGKPKQDLSVSGGLVHTHIRDPFLTSLPKEALEALARSYDEVLAKYAMPVVDVAQDASHKGSSFGADMHLSIASLAAFRLTAAFSVGMPSSARIPLVFCSRSMASLARVFGSRPFVGVTSPE
jgi:hypothetical protein